MEPLIAHASIVYDIQPRAFELSHTLIANIPKFATGLGLIPSHSILTERLFCTRYGIDARLIFSGSTDVRRLAGIDRAYVPWVGVKSQRIPGIDMRRMHTG